MKGEATPPSPPASTSSAYIQSEIPAAPHSSATRSPGPRPSAPVRIPLFAHIESALRAAPVAPHAVETPEPCWPPRTTPHHLVSINFRTPPPARPAPR